MTKHPQGIVWFPCVQDALAIGCLLALAGEHLDRLRRYSDRLILPIALVTVMMPAFRYPHGVFPLLIQSAESFGIAICIDHVIRHPYRWLNNKPIMWIGALSYSLYLWQEPFIFLHHIHAWWTRFPISLVCTLACACGSYYLVEQPFLRLRDRRKAAARRLVPAEEAVTD